MYRFANKQITFDLLVYCCAYILAHCSGKVNPSVPYNKL